MDNDLKKAKALIPLINDGRLNPEELRFIEHAAHRFPELKLELYRHERLHDLMRMVEKVPAPLSIEDNVLSTLKEQGPLKRFFGSLFSPRFRFPVEAVGASVAVVLIFFVVMLLAPRLSPTRMEKSAPSVPVAGTPSKPTAGSETIALKLDDEMKVSPGKSSVPAPPNTIEKTDKGIATDTFDTDFLPSPSPEMKSLSSTLPTSGGMTACVIPAEKVSKVITPTRDVLSMTVKKEETTTKTTFIRSRSDEPILPSILLLHNNDPETTRSRIFEKAISLGGSPETKDEKKKADEMPKDYLDNNTEETVLTIPPDRVEEFLDYLASTYPESTADLDHIRLAGKGLFLRIDIVPTIQ